MHLQPCVPSAACCLLPRIGSGAASRPPAVDAHACACPCPARSTVSGSGAPSSSPDAGSSSASASSSSSSIGAIVGGVVGGIGESTRGCVPCQPPASGHSAQRQLTHMPAPLRPPPRFAAAAALAVLAVVWWRRRKAVAGHGADPEQGKRGGAGGSVGSSNPKEQGSGHPPELDSFLVQSASARYTSGRCGAGRAARMLPAGVVLSSSFCLPSPALPLLRSRPSALLSCFTATAQWTATPSCPSSTPAWRPCAPPAARPPATAPAPA